MPFSVPCPACGEVLEVDDRHRAWRVRCPECQHEFHPDAAEYHRRPAPAAPPPDDDYDDRPARPRRRRRRRDDWDDRDDAEVVEDARRAVAGPASWLRVVGVLSVLAGVAGLVGTAILGTMLADDPAKAARDLNVRDEEELIVNTVLLGVVAVFSVALGGLMTYGAIRMGRVDSHGWGMAVSVIAISSIAVCGVCGVCTAPFGVWGLIVLARRDVQDGFAAAARLREGDWDRGRGRRYNDRDDD